MADVRSMLADPDFKALPPEERKKVLAKIAPEFMQLPEAEQAKVLGMPAAQQQQQEAPAMSRFFSSLGEMLNPIPAIKEYIDRPSQYAAMMEGVKGALAKEQTPQTGAGAFASTTQVAAAVLDDVGPGGRGGWHCEAFDLERDQRLERSEGMDRRRSRLARTRGRERFRIRRPETRVRRAW